MVTNISLDGNTHIIDFDFLKVLFRMVLTKECKDGTSGNLLCIFYYLTHKPDFQKYLILLFFSPVTKLIVIEYQL